jgi:glycosyltransferase involved in cell wall biosynthesis
MRFAKIYYRLKPFIPRGLRMSLRRRRARKILKTCGDTWPINEAAGKKPDGWPGWPDGKEFAFVLTHDVESQKGVDQVRQLAELEMELGFRSSFNFIPEGSYQAPTELREWLVENGFEVGVHDLHHNGRLYNSREGFRKKAERINHYLKEWGAVGFRSGFMLRELNWLHDLDISYDASTFDTDPFEPQPDGAKTIFPFIVSQGDRSYVELPYTLPQDSTLFLTLGEKDSGIWKRKFDWIVAKGGLVLLNVHPDYISFGSAGEATHTFPIEYYRDFLEYVASKGGQQCWKVLPGEVASWYQSEADSNTRRDGAAWIEDQELAGRELVSPMISGESIADNCLQGRRVGVVLLADYPSDPRPRRAAEALVAQGMEVEVICVRRKRSDPARLELNGVKIRRLPLHHKRGGKLAYAFFYLGFLTASFWILAFRSLTRRYALIHVHNMPDFLVFSSLLPRLFGAKVVLDLHDPMPELMQTIYEIPEQSRGVRLLKFVEKISIGYAHGVITVNETCRKIFAARSCPIEKVNVVMNSPDESIFALRAPAQMDQSDTSRPIVVMYHGSLVERNGLALAVEAVARVRAKNPRVELRIYGYNTPFLAEVLEKSKAEGIEDCVRYLGPKKIEEIVGSIDECDLGIIPNLRNIFTEINTPTRIFEFLARGKPVIAPSADGVLEYFGEEELVLFELGSAEDLADRIEFAVDHPQELLEITKRGQAVCVKHRWSQERVGFVGGIRKLLSGKGVRNEAEASGSLV